MENTLQAYEGQQLKIMIEVANSMPRELSTFVDDVYGEVMKDSNENKEFALSCIYCVPVGKDDKGVQKFHSDPSVRITEIMQKYWKHLRVIVNGDVEGDTITVNGLIVDCQANNAETLIDRVSCSGWKDRRKNLKLKAMQSTMKRDLRLSIMGKGYANQLKNKIFEGLFPDIVSGWKMCVDAFKNCNVTEQTLLSYFKINKASDVTKEMLFNALGIYNYIRENNEDPAEIFGRTSNKPNVTPADIKVSDKPKKAKKGSGKIPEVMGSEEFSSFVTELCAKAGVTVEEGLRGCCEVDHIDDILPELQSKVIDYLTDKAEV